MLQPVLSLCHTHRIVDSPTPPTRTRPPSDVATDADGAYAVQHSTPSKIDRYDIGRLIGAGGMGSVYEAFDTELKRKVAIKLLHRVADEDAPSTRRLLREARALARLSHPNVVEVFGAGIQGERVWLAMELVDGCTLKAWADAHPPAPPSA